MPHASFLPYQASTPLQVVLPNTALHLKALLDFVHKNGDKVVAGDEWLFEGPGMSGLLQGCWGWELPALLL